MRGLGHQITFASSVAAYCLVAASPSMAGACDLTEVKSSAKLHDTLSRRAVEAVERASRAGYRQDSRLSQLIEPSAAFDLGSGDVGRPLGKGVKGIRSLVGAMHANSFRFDGWNLWTRRRTVAARTK
jgi:hypothetical protein